MAETCNFEAIGTIWNIDIFDDLKQGSVAPLKAAILDRIAEFDGNYSRFRPDSLVSRMAAQAGTYQLPDDAGPMLAQYRKLYDITDGAVTPLIGRTLSDAGYDAEYSFTPGKVVAPPAWDEVLELTGKTLRLKRPALLDFGAAGKGYLTDIIGQLLDDSGVHTYCINAGGDVLYRTTSATTLPVALEHPADTQSAIGVAALRNQSLCGSSVNRRAWGKYHHILDPLTLESPKEILAVWVVSANGLVADGLATALFFVSPEKLAASFDFEYAIVRADMSLEHSTGFPAEFFS